MNWRGVNKLSIGILFILVTQSCSESNSINKKTIKIAVSKTPLSAPIYIAEAQGYFEQSCANVTLEEVIGGKASFEKVISGEAHLATSSDSVVVFKSLLRNDFAALATFVQSDNDVKIFTYEDSNIFTGKDLIGKSVGVTRGAAGEYLLSAFLALDGLSINDIHTVGLSPDKLPQALIDKSIDAAVVWEPYGYEIASKLSGKAKMLNTKNLYTLTFNLIGKRSSKTGQDKSCQCVISAVNQAIDFIAAEPLIAQQILKEKLQLDENFIQWVWPDYIFKLSLNRSLIMNLEAQAKWVIDSNLVTTKTLPDYKNYIDKNPLKAVKPFAVTIN